MNLKINFLYSESKFKLKENTLWMPSLVLLYAPILIYPFRGYIKL